MATKKKTEEYKSKAVTVSIKAISRVSRKMIDDNFYTLEYAEERSVPEDADLVKERALLWDTVNGEVDQMMADTHAMLVAEKEKYKNRNKK